MAVALGGLDALVFTAGIGEHSAAVRAAVCAPARVPRRRARPVGQCVGAAGRRRVRLWRAVRVTVIEAREDLVAAREARRLLQ